MTTNEFFKQWNGKKLDADGVYGAQCVDVIKQYFKDVLNVPVRKGNALDYWVDIPGFKRIGWIPGTSPRPGDIVVWDKTPTNPYGHIGICVWSRAHDFSSFEQNFPIGSPCHFQEHNYVGVLGWLRPLNQVDAPRPTPNYATKPALKPPFHLPLTIIGADVPGLAQQVLKWSRGDIILDVKLVPVSIPYNPAVDYEGYILNQGRFCIISCNPAPEIYRTTMPNGLRQAYAIAGSDAAACSYEVSHMLHKYYLAHRGTNPYIDIEDTVGGVTDEQRYRKYDVLKPYMAIILT